MHGFNLKQIRIIPLLLKPSSGNPWAGGHPGQGQSIAAEPSKGKLERGDWFLGGSHLVHGCSRFMASLLLLWREMLQSETNKNHGSRVERIRFENGFYLGQVGGLAASNQKDGMEGQGPGSRRHC